MWSRSEVGNLTAEDAENAEFFVWVCSKSVQGVGAGFQWATQTCPCGSNVVTASYPLLQRNPPLQRVLNTLK
jgi:hypothetical protein